MSFSLIPLVGVNPAVQIWRTALVRKNKFDFRFSISFYKFDISNAESKIDRNASRKSITIEIENWKETRMKIELETESETDIEIEPEIEKWH